MDTNGGNPTGYLMSEGIEKYNDVGNDKYTYCSYYKRRKNVSWRYNCC